MCGIAGFMTVPGKTPDASILDRFADALAHRGPDGHGTYIGGNVAMVQTRLAIIDLETGDQPLFAPALDEGAAELALVANGEIYNYVELREKMSDVRFATHSDCETALYVYREHGLDFAEHLRGMYAIAIHDPDDESLVLARDPFGIKPLYYAVSEDGFAFASEPQALIAAGLVTPSIDADNRDALLGLQFTTGAETVFSGIYRVLPGETLVVRDGRPAERKRRPALPPGPPRPITPDVAVSEFGKVITDAVGVHQRSDVGYGMFLSGGVDSSVLLAVMRGLNKEPVYAISAGFPGTDAKDEREHARAVAEAAGAEFDSIAVTEDDFWRELPRIVDAVDDPTGDYAIIPTYFLARRAREAGLKVVLSGEGGDELFAGYGRYRRVRRHKLLSGRRMYDKAILADSGVLREVPKSWRRGIDAAEREARDHEWNKLQVIQAVDVATWLPNDLLTKLDRCLMAHGVEGRVPFLDPSVADFAFRLPDKMKTRGRKGKWLLRKWLETALPEARPMARKKGFTVPVGEWISPRAAAIGPLVADQPGVHEVCDPTAVRALFAAGRKQSSAQWILLFYALWHQTRVCGVSAEGTIDEVLGAR